MATRQGEQVCQVGMGEDDSVGPEGGQDGGADCFGV